MKTPEEKRFEALEKDLAKVKSISIAQSRRITALHRELALSTKRSATMSSQIAHLATQLSRLR